MLLLAGIGMVGVLTQWFAWWVKLPAILFLLLIGLLVGPVTGLLDPDALFGDLLFPMVSLSVAVILFEGSLTLRFSDIRGHGKVVSNLVSIGAAVTWLVVALTTYILMDVSAGLSFLFGALVVVTGPTVIMPLLRTVRPRSNLANILRWEGILIDPLGAILAVLVYTYIISDQGEVIGSVAAVFGLIVLVGILVGVLAALLVWYVFRRQLIPSYLRNVFTLTLVFTVFAVSNHLEHESGLLAVTVMGIMLANLKEINLEDILDFKESLSLLLISGLFIILAARLDLEQFSDLGVKALFVLLVIVFIARPLTVFVSTLGSDLKVKEKLLLSWIAPRGIVAAAVSALFAIKLEAAGYPAASFLIPMTFMVIIGTVSLQSATAGIFARMLGLSEPYPNGVLIAGGNPVALAIGIALHEEGFQVMLADRRWDHLSQARMKGLNTFFGSPISEHADRHMDLVGYGSLLAISTRPDFNALACLRFRQEFGLKAVYELQVSPEKGSHQKERVAVEHRGDLLFGAEVTYGRLASLLSRKAEIRSTTLGAEFGFKDYQQKYRGRVIPLFAVAPNRRLYVFAVGREPVPEAGWIIIGLISPETTEALPDTQTETPG
jgi:CPA1 family monovalent cation:H+ antiporter